MKLPTQSRIVVVGGGAIGTSIAYHLAKSGEKEVLLLEKTQLTEGSTWHAAGLIGQMRGHKNLTKMMMQSVKVISNLKQELDAATDFKQVGSLRIANNKERYLEMKRQAGQAKGFGLEMNLISPKEAQELFPYLSIEGLVGAAFLPSDGYVDPYSLTHAYAKASRNHGAIIKEQCEVTGVAIKGRRVTHIETSQGNVSCDIVVNCAGMWAREFAALAGIRLPAGVVEHQFFVTERTGDMDPALPTLRDLDGGYYIKPEVGGFAVGGWEKATDPWAMDGVPKGFGRELFQGNQDRLEEIALPACERVPALGELGIKSIINGPIPISPDGEPIMGPVAELDNYYVAAAFTSGIAASGGVGQCMANWILEGDPGMDLWAFDNLRFGLPHTGRRYMKERSVEAYSQYYAMSWPGKELQSARGARRSPLYETLKSQNAVYGSKFGWERPNWFALPGGATFEEPSFNRPNWFQVVGEEHKAVREKVALIDMASFSKFEISGPGALGYLQNLACSNLDKPVGSCHYTQLLNEKGGIEADVTIIHEAFNKFYLVTGSAFGAHDLYHLRRHLPQNGSVHIQDVTSAKSVINLCGPLARKVLEKVTHDDVSNEVFPFMSAQTIWIGYAPVLAVRLTYVGELGWELHIPTEYALHVYEELQNAGEEFSIENVGYRAVDSLRLEKRFLAWGTDITPDYTPLEAGIGFTINWDKGNFIGRNALLKQKQTGLTQRLHCFSLDKTISVFGSETFIVGGEPIDITTSGGYGYSVNSNLVLGYLPTSITDYSAIELEVFGERHKLTPVKGSAYDPTRKKIIV